MYAAEWLARPLPERVPPADPVATTWGDRVAITVGLSLFFGLAGLTVLGIWTALGFVIDLF